MKKWYQVFGEYVSIYHYQRNNDNDWSCPYFLETKQHKNGWKSFKKYFQVHLDWSDLWSLAGEKVYRLIPRDIGHRTLSQYSVQRAPGKKLYTLSIYFESLISENTSIEKGRRNTVFRSFFRWMSLSSKKNWPRHFSIQNFGLDPKPYIQKIDQNIDLLGTISTASLGLAEWVIIFGLLPIFLGGGNPWSKEWGWR